MPTNNPDAYTKEDTVSTQDQVLRSMDEATAPVSNNNIMKTVEDGMRTENPEGEGGDAWYLERTDRVIDAVGVRTFFNMPLSDALKETGMEPPSPEMEKLYDNFPASERAVLFDMIKKDFMATDSQIIDDYKKNFANVNPPKDNFAE